MEETKGEKDLAEEAAGETKLNAIKASVFNDCCQAFRLTSRSSRAATRQQLMIDWFDIWIPATGAGLVNVNEGVLGILGYAFSEVYMHHLANYMTSVVSSLH